MPGDGEKTRTCRQRHVTIMEAVVACAIGAIILAQATRLCSKGWQASCRSIRRARDTQEIQVITEAWRAMIRPSKPADWATDGNRLTTGTHTAIQTQDGALQIRREADGHTRRFQLSRKTKITYTLEKPAGSQPLAVLWVHLPARKPRPPTRFRVVACPGDPQ